MRTTAPSTAPPKPTTPTRRRRRPPRHHLHGANFAAEYWDNVFEHFLAEYRAGRTPNPDILCNREIKFRAFLDYALELGADMIATGHYARRTEMRRAPRSAQGPGRNKDQSYFLHAVGHEELAAACSRSATWKSPRCGAAPRPPASSPTTRRTRRASALLASAASSDFLKRYLPAQPGEIRASTASCSVNTRG
jgi:tRNA-specific 2-thiouridylase